MLHDLNKYFRNNIKKYYYKNGRIFFWRKRKITPFQFLIVEILLKKTKAENVEKIINAFLKEYPCNKKLINATRKNIFNKISCLGLGKQRSKAIMEVSSYIKKYFNNRLPCSEKELLKIPYIGLYTCHAVLCFGFNERFDILDVNSSRIISRFFGIDNAQDLRDNIY